MSDDNRQTHIQMRWEIAPHSELFGSSGSFYCHYELVLPLDEGDIRREDEDGNIVRDKLVLPIKGPSIRGSSKEPCVLNDGSLYFDTPYRDGAHAKWDSKKLGGLKIVVIALDGTVIEQPVAA